MWQLLLNPGGWLIGLIFVATIILCQFNGLSFWEQFQLVVISRWTYFMLALVWIYALVMVFNFVPHEIVVSEENNFLKLFSFFWYLMCAGAILWATNYFVRFIPVELGEFIAYACSYVFQAYVLSFFSPRFKGGEFILKKK